MRKLELETWNQILPCAANTRHVVYHDVVRHGIYLYNHQQFSKHFTPMSCDPHNNLLTKAGQDLLTEELKL